MKFSYDFLQSFFKEKLPPVEELSDLLMMHFFEVEEVEELEGDHVLDIDILSNRAGDCLSHRGVAREIAAITGMKMSLPKERVKEDKEEIMGKVDTEVRGFCHRYMLRGIKNIKVGDSPEYIKKRLRSCGIRPINNIVDITNYVMLETGQPLHAFDADKIEGEKVIVRRAKKREKIVTLDEKRYDLDENVLVIADEFSPIGIAGIKGGIVPEVDKDTNTVYLEAANFDSGMIRKGSKKLGLRTDASLRFEYGIPSEFAEVAMERALSLMCDIAEGKALKGNIDHYLERRERVQIEFEAKEVRDILGVNVPLKDMERILKSLQFKVQRNGEHFYVTAPYFRLDVKEKEDVIEEIGRIYGYENIEIRSPKEDVVPPYKDELFFIENDYRELWKGFGLFETYNYSFINEEKASFFEKNELIEMEKPVSLEFKYLRPSLLPGLLKNLEENERRFEEVGLFEVGKVFNRKKEGVQEEKRFAAISAKDDFFDMKGKVDVLFKELLFNEVSYREMKDEDPIFNENRSADLFYQGQKIGRVGEVSEGAIKKARIKSSAAAAELDLDVLEKLRGKEKEYDPILRFPPSLRDIALLVPRETSYEEVFNKIKRSGGRTLRKISLFDVYEGEEIPEGKKSLAFRLCFQHKSKTLSSEEVNETQEKIMEALEEVPEWRVRR